MYRDPLSNLDILESINLANYTATVAGSGKDTWGMLDVLVYIPVGVVAAADATHFFTFSFSESDTEGGSYTAIASANIRTIDSWDYIINATTEAGNLHVVQLNRTKRWVKVTATESAGGAANANFGAYIVQPTDRHQPQSS
jgi:hypothetical protein